MPIEVRQMTIRSHVGPSGNEADHQVASQERLDALKEELLAECKQMIQDALHEQRER